jgi:hypothetical protein
MVAFSRETTNPDTLIRGCSWDRSARFQSNVILEDCDIKAFTWFYGASVEGPGPEWVKMRNNRVRTHITFSGWEGSRVPESYRPPKETAQLQSVVLHNNTFWGRVRIEKALQIELVGNRFPEGSAREILNIRASTPVR